MADRRKAKVTSRKRKKSQSFAACPFSDYAKNLLSEEEKVDQLLHTTNAEKFPNLYYERRFPIFQGQKLNLKKKLTIPSDMRQSVELRLDALGLSFVDRVLVRVNNS
ncbi:hypothetical protein AHAS_Ahas03G0216600 [Arachis hypogaea]